MALSPALGNYVTGPLFFGRAAELAELREKLRAGQHVTLVAQRRMGKTSLCKESARVYAGEFSFFYVDLQHKRDAADAVAAIAAAAKDHTSAWFKLRGVFENLAGAVDSIGNENLSMRLRDALAGDWRPKGERVMHALADLDATAVIILDELPILLTNLMLDRDGRWRAGGREAVAEFLEWLRAMCIAFQGRLIVVVTGSIGLTPVAARAGASGALNHYAQVSVGAWESVVAIRAIHELLDAAGMTATPDAAQEVVERLGSCIPYHVQLLVDHLVQDARKRGGTLVGARDVQRVYTTRLLASHGHIELAHMEERLLKVLPFDVRALATDLLTQAAVCPPLTPAAALMLATRTLPDGVVAQPALQDILAVLEHDGYLRREAEGWRFVSSLLRDWWKARHATFFTAVDTSGR